MKILKNQHGTAMVETAICLPVFLFLSFGLIQLALIMQNLITVKNASIVAVRTAVADKNYIKCPKGNSVMMNFDIINIEYYLVYLLSFSYKSYDFITNIMRKYIVSCYGSRLCSL